MISYVEYGKYFIQSGATDFLALSYSDEQQKNSIPFFRNILDYPSQTTFSEQSGNVSVALLANRDSYLFVHLQRRREGELIQDAAQIRTNRPFNQIRFVSLTEKELKEQFAKGEVILPTLLATQPKHVPRQQSNSYYLPNYFSVAGKGNWTAQPTKIDHQLVQQAKAIVNELIETHDKNKQRQISLVVIAPELPSDLYQRVQFLSLVSYLAAPYIGILTFACDYITEQPLRFYLLREKEGYLKQRRNMRIRTLRDLMEKNWSENYAAYASKLTPMQLYDTGLQHYLSESDLTMTQAFQYAKIEREGQDYPNRQQAIKAALNYAHISGRNTLFKTLRKKEIIQHLSQRGTDEKITLALLHHAAERSDYQLDQYADYHCSLHQVHLSAANVRDLFQKVVTYSPANSLQHMREQHSEIYDALLRWRHWAKQEPNRPYTVGFDSANSPPGISIIKALLQIVEDNKQVLELLQQKLVEDSRNNLLGELLKVALPAQLSNQIGKLIAAKPLDQLDSYFNFCQWLDSQKVLTFMQGKRILQPFLKRGQALASRERQSLLASVQTRPRLYKRLRKLFLQEAKIDVEFAESFYLFNELAELPQEAFSADYQRLRVALHSHSDIGQTSEKFRCLIFPQERRFIASLRQDTPWILYQKVFSNWINTEMSFAQEHVQYLIGELPNDIANTLLADIVKRPSSHQVLTSLSVDFAQKWLEKTTPHQQPNLRQHYRVDNKDQLRTILKQIQDVNDAYIYYLLDKEITIKELRVYLQDCQYWLSRVKNGSELHRYLNAATELGAFDPPPVIDQTLITLWAELPSPERTKKHWRKLLKLRQQSNGTHAQTLLRKWMQSATREWAKEIENLKYEELKTLQQLAQLTPPLNAAIDSLSSMLNGRLPDRMSTRRSRSTDYPPQKGVEWSFFTLLMILLMLVIFGLIVLVILFAS